MYGKWGVAHFPESDGSPQANNQAEENDCPPDQLSVPN
ncbi:hypothetical protein JOC94_003575 [Bacillus thermophilus]|uniref:Uncharacterized protein n=1 Tax=Siminovitchia thermophila TaxID=1245522 RepID=A0ABS2RB18_9BACI|nr:hypothetical protein [Siminovitchia thermophila]